MLSLGFMAFLNPWMLLALGLLPLIWLLLRITPPRPNTVTFPPVRILAQLARSEETPASTPWWLMLLRLLLALLLILALSHPVLDPEERGGGGRLLVLVLDDGWSAAPGWERRRAVAVNRLQAADRNGRAALLVRTAPDRESGTVTAGSVMPAGELVAEVQALNPNPWPADRAAALTAIRDFAVGTDVPLDLIWLSDGADGDGGHAFAEGLADLGALTVYLEETGSTAIVLATPEDDPAGLRITARRARAGLSERVGVRLLATDGRLLDRQEFVFEADETAAGALLTLPADLRNDAVQLVLEQRASAAGSFLFDERWRRRPVGVISGTGSDAAAQPLLADTYYLERALAPFSEVRRGELQDLLQQKLAMVVLADVGRIGDDEVARLQDWIEAGGVLVRFAGPRLAKNADSLLPVTLRQGGRALGGALSWSRPARIAAPDPDGLFAGLPSPDDVQIRRQVLAQPSLELDSRTWIRLEDGTPLVTAEQRGDGWVVLFHITANAEWSNLPLSGLFVQMLRRLSLSARGIAERSAEALPPVQGLDGYGRLGPAPDQALPLPPGEGQAVRVGPQHPPGLYGSEQFRTALNLGPQIERFDAIDELPAGVRRAGYDLATEHDLRHWLLIAAVSLALVELIAAMALRGLFRPRREAGAALSGLLAFAVFAALSADEARAQAGGAADDRFALEALEETRLAFVVTGDNQVDAMSRAGLMGLSEMLHLRTAIEPGSPMGVNVEVDELALFPLLYWPVAESQPRLSGRAVERIAQYMRSGGAILFDTQDAPLSSLRGFGATPAQRRLRALLGRLDVPPLVPVPADHVLTKAFYLMQSFPGRYDEGRLWVEQRAGGVNDGVASLMIGANDWSAAWAIDGNGRPLAAMPGGPGQREWAYRFGVNLVMYALTGNYKADQVHIPFILERLGQ